MGTEQADAATWFRATKNLREESAGVFDAFQNRSFDYSQAVDDATSQASPDNLLALVLAMSQPAGITQWKTREDLLREPGPERFGFDSVFSNGAWTVIPLWQVNP